MKQGWETREFEKCLDKVKATTKIPKKQFLAEGAFPVISQEDEFINGYWNNPNDVFKVERPIVIFGDHTKKVKYVDFDFVLDADGVKVLSPIDCINPRFFYYQIKSIPLDDLGYARHYRLLRNEKLSIPPLSEQKRIVAILDRCFEAIDKAKANVERNLQNAKDLFQSQLNQVFTQKGDGWVEKKLGEVGTLTSSKRIFKKEYVGDGVPFYRSKEIKELAHKKDITLELFITRERYNEIKSQFGIPQKGDILLTAVGTIGEMYVVQSNDEFYFKDGNIMWLKDFTSLNTHYLKYALTTFVEHVKAMSQGSAYNALTIEKLKEYSVPIPPIDRQDDIVLSLDSVQEQTQSLESKYQEQLDALDELKKSILQKAFNGELTVDEEAA